MEHHCRPIALLLAALLAAGPATRAATLPAAADTYSSSGKLSKTTNHATTLLVDPKKRAYLFFDLADLPDDAQIRAARLRLYLPKVTKPGGGLTVHLVTGSWDENLPGAEPAYDSTAIAAIPGGNLLAKNFVSVDLTAAAQGWLAAPSSNQGLAIVAGALTNVGLGAKEGSGTGYVAELEIELVDQLLTLGSIDGTLLGSDLTLSGVTSGNFSGNGSLLTHLKAANLQGQLTSHQLGADLTFSGVAAGSFSGDGSRLQNVKAAGMPYEEIRSWQGIPSLESISPAGLVDVKAIAMGTLHRVALLGNGSVVTWEPPATVLQVHDGLDAIAIAAAEDRTMALRRDGTVVTWGGNAASPPDGLSGVVAIAMGMTQSLALKNDGTVVAWGARGGVPNGLSGVKAITSGDYFSAALKTDGTVVTWGDDSVPANNFTDIRAIEAGAFHLLALKNDGTVAVWGIDASGNQPPDGLSGVVAVQADYGFSMALKHDGTVVYWGPYSAQGAPPGDLHDVVEMAAGRFGSMVRSKWLVTPTTLVEDFREKVSKSGDNMTGRLRLDFGESSDGSRPELLFGGSDTGEGIGSKRTGTTGRYGLDFYTADVARLRITNQGLVGIGRVPATNSLEVEGDASKTTATAWLANSDRRIKMDIRPVEHALETIDRLRPVTFRYTEEYRQAHPGVEDREYHNVIAQEFADVFPTAVKGSGEKLGDGGEILQVDTYPASITALAAIQELHAQVREKDGQIEKLRAEQAALAERLERVEKRFGEEQP